MDTGSYPRLTVYRSEMNTFRLWNSVANSIPVYFLFNSGSTISFWFGSKIVSVKNKIAIFLPYYIDQTRVKFI